MLAKPVLLFLLAALPSLACAQQPEQEIFRLTNQDRAAQGLQALQWDPALAKAASAHAQLMVQQKQLSHQYPGEPGLTERAAQADAHFRAIAENIAMGPNPAAIEKQWMHSVPHRTNILDPRMNSIGVAVVEQNGYDYAVEDFSDGVKPLTSGQIEQQVGQLLSSKGIQPSGPADEARKDCAAGSGHTGPSKPGFLMRWEGSDLSRLPQQLDQAIQSGRFHTAAVGACPVQMGRTRASRLTAWLCCSINCLHRALSARVGVHC